MKNLFILIITIVFLPSCSDSKVIELNDKNRLFETYGFANEERIKNDSIYYEVSPESVIWSIILCETVIAPVYFIGWDLYEPKSIKTEIK